MKNLKKVLSLALVFAMVLGLCIGASAAQDVTSLSDWGDVAHKGAAQLLNSFNIMQGYGDKTFRPSRLVTRAEAVKMIDVGLWGGVDQPDRFVSNEVAFTDVKPTDWYAGHVTYAETIGILDGYPDGTFRPNENVTGYQLLKMALIALNYNSEVENLTGAGWDIRTMRLATDPTVKNLTTGLSDITNWNAPLTRDQAAQIIANMIMHEYITYDLIGNGQGGYVKVTNNGTFGRIYLGLTEEHGTLVANAYANKSAKTYTNDTGVASTTTPQTINAKRSSNNVLVKVGTKGETVTTFANREATLDSTLADIGRPVTLYYKSGVLVGAALDSWTEVEAEWNSTYTAITNYEGDNTAATIPTYTHGNLNTADYVVTKYYDTNGNGLIDIVTNTCYGNATEVKAVVASKNYGNVYQVNTITWRSSYENAAVNHDNFVVEDEANFTAKKGDYIAHTTLTNVFGDYATYGVVLDTINGSVSRVVNNDATFTHTVTIDGVTYDVADSLAPGRVPFGTTGTFYLYPDEQIGAFKANEAPETHYGVVYDADFTTLTSANGIHTENRAVAVQICAILDDGTSGVYTVNGMWQGQTFVPTSALDSTTIEQANASVTINGTATAVKGFFNSTNGDLYDVNNTKTAVNKLITYTVNDDGSLNITVVTGTPVSEAVTTAAGSPTFGSKYFTGKSLTFVQTKADGKDEAWTVAVGLPTSGYTVKNSGATVYTENLFTTNTTADNNKIVALVIDAEANGGAVNVLPEFVYVISDNGVIGTNNATDIHEVTIYSSATDTIETVKVNSNTVTPGAFYESYTAATSTFGDSINPSTKAGFITSFADNVIGLTRVTTGADQATTNIVTKTDAYVVGRDTRYYYIDGAQTSEIAMSEVGTQGIVDWSISIKPVEGDATHSTKNYTEYYQAAVIVKPNTNEALQVIIFAGEQKFATAPYGPVTIETPASPR